MSKGTKTVYLPGYLLEQFLALTSATPTRTPTTYITRAVKPRRATQPPRAVRKTYINLDTPISRTTSASRSTTPKARKINKPNLDGTPQTKPRRLWGWDFTMPGDPGYKPPRSRAGAGTKPRPSRPASQNIKQSARAAAEWLADRFPNDVAEVGHDQFIADRYAEILAHDFNPRYWEECPKTANYAEVAIPTSVLDPEQQTTPPGDPARLRSKTTYTTSSKPYPNPGLGADLPTPTPGYRGSNIDGRFRDLYLAADVQEFKLPRTVGESEYVPCFADCTATYHVITTQRPTRTQFSTKTRAVWLHPENRAHEDQVPIDTRGRFLYHTKSLPSDAPPAYDRTEQRLYLVDANIQPGIYPSAAHDLTHVRMKHAPAAARGRYFADSDDIHVELEITQQLWLARNLPEDTEPNYITIEYTPHDYGWVENGGLDHWRALEYIGWNLLTPYGVSGFYSHIKRISLTSLDGEKSYSQPHGTGGETKINPPTALNQPGYHWIKTVTNGQLTGEPVSFWITFVHNSGYKAFPLPGRATQHYFPAAAVPSTDWLEENP